MVVLCLCFEVTRIPKWSSATHSLRPLLLFFGAMEVYSAVSGQMLAGIAPTDLEGQSGTAVKQIFSDQRPAFPDFGSDSSAKVFGKL